MPDTHRVIITDDAIHDLERAVAHIQGESPQNATAMAEVLLKAIGSLAYMLHRFRVAGMSRKRGTTVRAIVVFPFIIYYSIDDRIMSAHVLRVIHGARRPPKRIG